MNTLEDDKKLRQLLKSVKPESPGAGFSDRVMNRVFEEQPALEQVKREPILGKGFWIIFALFGALIAAIVVFPEGKLVTDSTASLLRDLNTGAVISGYQSFFEKLGSLPLSIAGIMLATSLLVVIEKFLGTTSESFSSHYNC